jgi:hypothetical protein
MCVFAVLWWPEKEKMAHKNKELKNACFCSAVVAQEGKNGPKKEELKNVCFCSVVVSREGKKAHKKKYPKLYVFPVLWWP